MIRLRPSLVAAALSFMPFLAASAMAQSPGNRNDCILDNCRDRQPREAAPGEDSRPDSRRGDAPRERSQRDNAQRDFERPYGRDRFNDGPRGNERPGGERAGAPSGRFDFYVLALSWSPTFCQSEAGRRSREQCARGANNAFVVHGLWPQYERGSPSYCDDRAAPRFAIEQARGVFPEEGLARYQWRKHGSCSGLAPTAYFALAKEAKEKVVIPAELRNPNSNERMDPGEIERAFIEANRTLRPGMIAVTCVRGQLQEVRICLSKDVREFRPCPEVTRAACRIGNVSVPAPR